MYDCVEGAIKGLVQLGALNACDSIYEAWISSWGKELGDGNEYIAMDPYLVALGKLGDERAFQKLEDAVNHNVEWIQDNALDALRTIGGERATEMLGDDEDQ